MSFKYAVTQVGPSKFILPKMAGMHCEITAFLSPALLEKTEEKMWQDAVASASAPGAIGMYLMPDCHQGYVLPVGGVLVTQGTVLQAGSGYDIGCGVVQLRVPGLHAADLADWEVRKRWVAAVERRVSMGLTTERAELVRAPGKDAVEEMFRHGAKAVGVSADQCERQYIRVSEHFDSKLIQRAASKAPSQIGSIGSGNHYVELQADRDTGEVWIMIHCGSRGFGWQAADYFYRRGADLRGLPASRREESWLRLDEPLGELYWAWHNAAANYAMANRHVISHGIGEATEEVFGKKPSLYYEISHNLVQEETLVLPDGTTQRGLVHRKGATRAFPAGHPDLARTRWAETGHPCLIPGSMIAGAAILFPLEGAYASGCSVNHGSGRQMARNAAKRDLHEVHSLIDEEMRTIRRSCGGVDVVGVVSNCAKTPLDECGAVYKDLDEVLAVLETNQIARVAHRLFPTANLKGAD